MNCPECGGQTTIVYCRFCTDGTERRRRECKACKQTYITVEIREDMLDDYLAEREKDRVGRAKRSLCWQCKRAYGGCSWSRDFLPVKGWEAVQTVIKADEKARNPEVESYKVIKCPLFVQDRKK